jgi:uncharacterized protein
MVVKIEEIQEQGLQVKERLALEQLSEALEGSGFKATEPLEYEARLRKVSGGVLLEGRFNGRLATACRRCLDEARLELPVRFLLNLVPRRQALPGVEDEEAEGQDRGHGESAGSFELDEADEESFDGKQIDLDPIFREQMLLALPMNALCREDCQGLCPQCGQNLNQARCGCQPQWEDPRWAALKSLKVNS